MLPDQRGATCKIICAGEVRQCNEDRADAQIRELKIPLHMINCRGSVMAGGVDAGRQASTESLHPYCDVLAVGADHRQVEDGDLYACRIATYRSAMPVQNVDLGLQHRLVRRQVASVGLLGDDPQRPPLSRTSDNDGHIANGTGIARGFWKVHIAAVVGLGAGCPQRSDGLDADLKLIKSLAVAGKVQTVRLVFA